MKHIKLFEKFVNESYYLNEGINYRQGVDADLEEVGVYVVQSTGGDPETFSEKELEKFAVDAMKKAKPVQLTGKIKTDLTAFLKYIDVAFKKCGIILDTKNTEIDSSNFTNELMIPVVNSEFYFNTLLDYSELAYNGSEFVIGGSFASDNEGSVGDIISDLSDMREIAKVCKEFKTEYLGESVGYKKYKSLNENKKVSGSKIGTYFSVKGDEFNFGYKYGEYEGDNYEDVEFISDQSLKDEVGNIDSYIKELKTTLKKAYTLLKTKDKKKVENFLDDIDSGLFGVETYNGWMYMDDIDNEPHVSSDDPEFSAMYDTVLYVIAKIEAFLAYRKN